MYRKKPIEKSSLDEAIDQVLSEMKGYCADSDEYAQMTKQLTKLYKLKTVNQSDRVSKDTLALIFGNLIGIAMIVGHERANVVTSKALSLLRQLR